MAWLVSLLDLVRFIFCVLPVPVPSAFSTFFASSVLIIEGASAAAWLAMIGLSCANVPSRIGGATSSTKLLSSLLDVWASKAGCLSSVVSYSVSEAGNGPPVNWCEIQKFDPVSAAEGTMLRKSRNWEFRFCSPFQMFCFQTKFCTVLPFVPLFSYPPLSPILF